MGASPGVAFAAWLCMISDSVFPRGSGEPSSSSSPEVKPGVNGRTEWK